MAFTMARATVASSGPPPPAPTPPTNARIGPIHARGRDHFAGGLGHRKGHRLAKGFCCLNAGGDALFRLDQPQAFEMQHRAFPKMRPEPDKAEPSRHRKSAAFNGAGALL